MISGGEFSFLTSASSNSASYKMMAACSCSKDPTVYKAASNSNVKVTNSLL